MPLVHYFGYGMAACLKPGPPGDWKDDDTWTNNWGFVSCPDCLKGKDYLETFIIASDSKSGKSITCKRCNRTSYNSGDIEHHWCWYCQVSHDDLWPPARRHWITHPEPDLKIIKCECGFWFGFKPRDTREAIRIGMCCPQCRVSWTDKLKALKP